MTAELFLLRQDELGEGILVQSELNRICWVDILGRDLFIADMKGENIVVFPQKTEVAAVLPTKGGDLVLVLRNTVLLFDPDSGATQRLWSADDLEPASNRFNDAAIDPFGNLWIGSMDFDATAPSGVLYRVTPDGQADVIARGFACLNGPAFSPDGKAVYVGDTMAGRVLVYSCGPQRQDIGAGSVFLQLGRFEGLPDGMTVDAQGNLWVCRITVGLISCYSADGHKLHSIALPVPNVTSCCFGGPNLSTLYATTARILMDSADLAAFPNSGSLFQIETACKGSPPHCFGAVTESNSP